MRQERKTRSTIKRSQLIKATEQTIKRGRTEGINVRSDLAKELREVARTADKIAWGWWSPKGQCGCLIGTRRIAKGLSPNPARDPRPSLVQERLGFIFVKQLLSVGVPEAEYYKVVDDD